MKSYVNRIRYEQEGKLAKGLESEKLLKEAEEARLAHAARKEKAAAESRYACRTGGKNDAELC